MKTAIEIIEEISKYYIEDPTRRAYRARGCSYLQENGNKCALGYCFNDKANFDYIGDIYDYIESQKEKNLNFSLDQHLKEEYKGHSSSFWKSLQIFHDDENNWFTNKQRQTLDYSNPKLTEEGNEFLTILKNKYNN